MGRGLRGHLGPDTGSLALPVSGVSLGHPSTPTASRQSLAGRTEAPEPGSVALAAQGGSPVPSLPAPCPPTATTSASTRTNPAAR